MWHMQSSSPTSGTAGTSRSCVILSDIMTSVLGGTIRFPRAISKEKKNSSTIWPPGTVEWAWDEIAWASNTALYCYNFEPNIRLMPDATGLELGFRPYSLIGLIWQQFAMVVTIRDRWTVCQYCGEPFEAKRKGRMYCSDSHRQMACQKRREAHE